MNANDTGGGNAMGSGRVGRGSDGMCPEGTQTSFLVSWSGSRADTLRRPQ